MSAADSLNRLYGWENTGKYLDADVEMLGTEDGDLATIECPFCGHEYNPLDFGEEPERGESFQCPECGGVAVVDTVYY